MASLPVLRTGILRTFTTSSRNPIQNRVLEKQKIFQADNNLPVHLKGGVGDVLLYRFTMTLSLFGTAYSIFQLVKAAFPRAPK
ncbi:cytochrome c oxidase subunit 7A1, mitochondrial-like [Ambystoma mexicanum]|uniref:cytochrome c oxidase subunit 7A1, mitochondrial-like n=1 Tax=Ambystoma mexicanum TaxID=8296 RepID=UPI0037E9183C